MIAKRERPGGETGADLGDHRNSTAIADIVAAEHVRITRLMGELMDSGYRIAVDCSRCGHALTATPSILREIGPKCAKRVAE